MGDWPFYLAMVLAAADPSPLATGALGVFFGLLWIGIGALVRNDIIAPPPPGWRRLGWRLPTSKRQAAWLQLAGLVLVLVGIGFLGSAAL